MKDQSTNLTTACGVNGSYIVFDDNEGQTIATEVQIMSKHCIYHNLK